MSVFTYRLPIPCALGALFGAAAALAPSSAEAACEALKYPFVGGVNLKAEPTPRSKNCGYQEKRVSDPSGQCFYCVPGGVNQEDISTANPGQDFTITGTQDTLQASGADHGQAEAGNTEPEAPLAGSQSPDSHAPDEDRHLASVQTADSAETDAHSKSEPTPEVQGPKDTFVVDGTVVKQTGQDRAGNPVFSGMEIDGGKAYTCPNGNCSASTLKPITDASGNHLSVNDLGTNDYGYIPNDSPMADLSPEDMEYMTEEDREDMAYRSTDDSTAAIAEISTSGKREGGGERREPSDDRCRVGTTYGGADFSCDGTLTMIDTQRYGDAISEQAGSVFVAKAGFDAQLNALDGGQAEILRGQAEVAHTTASAEVAQSSLNMVAGATILMQASKHRSRAAEIENQTSGNASLDPRGSGNVTWENGQFGEAIGGESGNDYNRSLQESQEAEARRRHRESLRTELRAAEERARQFTARNLVPARRQHSEANARFQKVEQQFFAAQANGGQIPPALMTAYQNARSAKEQADRRLENATATAHQLRNQRDQLKRGERSARNEMQKAFIAKQKAYGKGVQRVGAQGQGEQINVARDAEAAGAMAIIKGMTKAGSAAINYLRSSQLNKMANKIRGESETEGGGVSFGGFDPGEASGARNRTIINGAGVNPNHAGAIEDEEELEVADDLGTGPFIPEREEPVDPDIERGRFLAKEPGNAAGGGGLGLGGGGSTSAATGSEDAPTDEYAGLGDGAGSYDVGGGGAVMGGGGGGRGPAGEGLDLNSLMAKFLPGEKEDQESGDGILQFGGKGGGARAPASLLGRNVNIFHRIHQTYQEKAKKKAVSL